MYHPTITAAVASEHRSTLLRAAEHNRHVSALRDNRRHIKLVRPQWWTRLATSFSTARLAQA